MLISTHKKLNGFEIYLQYKAIKHLKRGIIRGNKTGTVTNKESSTYKTTIQKVLNWLSKGR